MSDEYEEDPLKRFQQLPESEQQTIQALKGVEVQQQDIRYQYQLELLALRKKYAGILDPLYDRRVHLIAGTAKPEGKELETGEQGLRKIFGKEFKTPSRRSLSKNGIENFWLAVIMNHPGLSLVISQRDQEALKYLTDIRSTYFTPERPPLTADKAPVSSYATITSGETGASTISSHNESSRYGKEKDEDNGYRLSFHFRSNPYFTDPILEKTYIYKKGQIDEFGDLLYERAIGSQIHWKSGMDLTQGNNSNDDEAEDDEPSVSFFTFFSPKEMPSDSEVEKLSDEEYTALLDEIEGDFECGEDIRDELIPYALTYLVDPPSYDDDDDDDDDGKEVHQRRVIDSDDSN